MRGGGNTAREGGFTLMEMMMVIAIVGLIMGVSVMTLRSVTRADLRSSAGKTAAAMRFAFDRALMTGSYLRLAIDLDKGRLWLERTTDRVSLRTTAQEREDEEREGEDQDKGSGEQAPKAKRPRNNPLAALGMGGAEGEGDEGGSFGVDAEMLARVYETANEPPKRPKPRFSRFKGPGVKEVRLKGGISVDRVKTARMEDAVEKGMAYIYFFPQGHAEPSIVRLMNNSEDYYSVVLHPLTGSARIYPCAYRIPEEFGEHDDAELQKKKRRRRDICEES